MKNLIAITLILFFGYLSSSYASVWRLNNIPGINADFNGTLQEAINGVSPGDTIYVEPSPTSYGNALINKQVFLIGAGYWLNENDSTQANKDTSAVGVLTFNPGSEGSVVTGLYIYYNAGSSYNWKLINIKTDSITIQRNFIYGYAASNSTSAGYNIYFDGDRNNIVIQQNWIYTKLLDNYSSYNGNVYSLYSTGAIENIEIRNNFIRAHKAGSYGAAKAIHFSASNPTNINFTNNVIWGDITTYNASHINNILLSGSFYALGNNICLNNLCDGTQYPTGNGNQQNVDMSTVFIDHTQYIDNAYLLAANSPAIAAGINGGDCGAFGNGFAGHPYILSGMPAIPAIFDINFTPNVTDTIPIQINFSAKTHN